jgi:F-type H+-transporting ATPase subunit b
MLRTLLLILTVAATPAFLQTVAARDFHRSTDVQAPLDLAGQPSAEAPQHEEGGAEEEHRETIWGPISRLFNASLLFGVLYYYLRRPIAAYLSDRSGQIRGDLVTAEEMKQAAAAQIAELEKKMAALPAELETLKVHGQQQIAAEEKRIDHAAAVESERLLEQTRREIDLQLRIAHRELVEHAAHLAVGVATDRIKKDITPDDQTRLVDRYLQQVKP